MRDSFQSSCFVMRLAFQRIDLVQNCGGFDADLIGVNRIVVCAVVPFGLNGQLIRDRLTPKLGSTQVDDLPASLMQPPQESSLMVCLIVQDFESVGWVFARGCSQLQVRNRE